MKTDIPDPLSGSSIPELGARLRSGDLTAVGLTEACLARIAMLDGQLASFVKVMREEALQAATRADKLFSEKIDLGPLHGIPYAVKDIFDIAGQLTICNSHIVSNSLAMRSSAAVEKLDAAGAICLGKLATHEFALGGPSMDLPYPPARNPYDMERFTGASSSGSGVAVAARFTAFALGSDTSGSIRGPASACGVCGFKPTFGLLSRRGTFPLSFSLDHVGPLGRSVKDCALIAQAMSGHDPEDPTSVVDAVDFCSRLGSLDLKDMTIGVARNFLPPPPGSDPQVYTAIKRVISLIEAAGARIVDAILPDALNFEACGRVLMTAESYAIHRESINRDGSRFGRFTYQRVAPGAFLSAADLVRAQQVRRILIEASEKVFRRCDAVLAPGSLFLPPKLTSFGADWPPPPEVMAARTIAANVLGIPAISLPVGLSSEGLPMGLQIMGSAFNDAKVIGVASRIESVLRDKGIWNAIEPQVSCDLNQTSQTAERHPS